MARYEFHAYHGDASGSVSASAVVTTEQFPSDTQAKAKAGRLSKLVNGPVDLARHGNSAWEKRYMTTASPSEFHASGYRFERLT